MNALHQILRWQQAERSDADRLGISTPAYHLLCIIAAADGHKSSKYARLMDIKPAVISHLLTSLVKHSYVTRTSRWRDRRTTICHISDLGAEKLSLLHNSKQKIA